MSNNHKAEPSREPRPARPTNEHEHKTVKLKRDPFLARLRDSEGESLVYASILHATDITRASRPAFAHALALALTTRGVLSVVHVAEDVAARANELPGIRNTLIRWGRLTQGATRRDVGALGFEVHKFRYAKRAPREGLMEALETQYPDLFVVATRRGSNPTALMSTSIARPVAREATCPTLFFPHGVRGFIAEETGEIQLNKILVAIDRSTQPRAVSLAAERLARTLRHENVAFRALYLGGDTPRNDEARPEGAPGWSWESRNRPQGGLAKNILAEATAWEADLIVMARNPRRPVLDIFRSPPLDRVLDRSSCPVLALQANA